MYEDLGQREYIYKFCIFKYKYLETINMKKKKKTPYNRYVINPLPDMPILGSSNQQ